MEIDADEEEITFTGINTKQSTAGYYSPFAGKVDMNLNLQWSKTYSFDTDRFSGVDVEYSNNNNFLMLMNSDKYDFAVMEISYTGLVLQQPVKYQFSLNGEPRPARSHVMHLNKTNIYITGNMYEAERTQHLYSYEILNASNLSSGDAIFKSYSRYIIPVGKQVLGWNINLADESGVVLTLNTSVQTSYSINVYNTAGQKVHTEKINADGQKVVYLKFKTSEQIYLVNVNNGKIF